MTPSIEELKRGLSGLESVEHCLTNGVFRGTKNNCAHLIQAHSYIDTLKDLTLTQIKEMEPDEQEAKAAE